MGSKGVLHLNLQQFLGVSLVLAGRGARWEFFAMQAACLGRLWCTSVGSGRSTILIQSEINQQLLNGFP